MSRIPGFKNSIIWAYFYVVLHSLICLEPHSLKLLYLGFNSSCLIEDYH